MIAFLAFVFLVTNACEKPAVDPPYPRSPVIKEIIWAPADTIKRFAQGSDNWPMTWGDDGNIYTAYGDGWGFEAIGQGPKIRLGISRIDGTPANPQGHDLAELANWNQNVPNIKASGIILVDGVLYMWVRRDGGNLRKSYDRGQTWMDTGIRMEQPNGDFHNLDFAQFGPNYESARDDYVYVYSVGIDGNNEGKMYLFKALRTQLDNRSSYLFFSGFDSAGLPSWSSSIAARQPIIHDTIANEIDDVRVVYNPGIKRYLLTYSFNQEGGIAILDGPEPWGPWTTVFYEPQWGGGFTFEYAFPRKWMSSDGLMMHMVYSGTGQNDAFVVRRATLKLTRPH